MPWMDMIRYHNFLGKAKQLHGKHGRCFRKWHILLSNYRGPEKSQAKIPNWLNRRPHVRQYLPAQNYWQMPQVLIYTDESYNGQRPVYTRCLAAKRSPGDVNVRYIDVLHDTGQSWSKLGRFRLVWGWRRGAAASIGNITKSIICMQRIE